MTFAVGARVRLTWAGSLNLLIAPGRCNDWHHTEWTIIGIETLGREARLSFKITNGAGHIWVSHGDITYYTILDEMAAIT